MPEENFLKPITKAISIEANPSEVWEIISKPGNLEHFHPFCKSNPVEKWPGDKSIDYVHYYNGLKFERFFTDWIEGKGYDLLIGKKNGNKSKVIWRINKLNDSSSELEITIYPHDINNYQYFFKSLIYIFYIKPMLLKYLNSVLKGFQLFILQGKPIQKNQFGTHKWFSN